MEFIEYLKKIIHSDNSIDIKGSKIILKESNSNSKLQEVSMNYNSEKYDVFLMTLDENNLLNKKEMFPYFIIPVCSTVDYVLFIKDKETAKYFIFHIELKSQNPKKKNILKKHITSSKIIDFILNVLYLKILKESDKNIKIKNFPSEFYQAIIVLYQNNNQKTKIKNEIEKRSYEQLHYNGTLKEEIYFYTKGLVIRSSKPNSVINLKDLCEYFQRNIKEKSIEICEKIYN